jgi:hypothetical protein
MASIPALYVNSTNQATWINQPLKCSLCDGSSCRPISPELARYHVDRMDEADLRFCFRMYARARTAGVELSTEGPTRRGVDVLLPGCDAPDADGRPSVLNPVSGNVQAMPEAEKSTRTESRGDVCRGGKGFEFFT